MSNENNEREILSAYFDGELSSTDSRRAEQMLEDSVTTRREIDEMAELSELVKSLPPATAPAELLPAVMQQAERETLLPSPSPTAAAKQKSRTLLATLAGVAATAAAIIVTIQFLPSSTDSRPQATANYKSSDRALADNESADADRLKTAEAPNSLAFDSRNGSIETPEASGNSLAAAKSPASASPMAAQTDATKDHRGSFARRAAGKSGKNGDGRPVTESQPSGSAGSRGSRPSPVPGETLSMNAQLLKNARRGDEFQFFSTDGTKVTTYMVTVVDVNRALDKLEVLLAKNEIPARMLSGEEQNSSERAKPGEGKAIADRKRKTDGDKATPNGQPPSRMIAVYVETTPDQFRSAMRELYQDKMLADLDVKPPVDESQIEVADLGRTRRQLFREMDGLTSGEKKAAAQTEQTETKPSAPVDAPVPAATSPRKLKQSEPQNAPAANDKSVTENRPAKENNRSVANKNDLRRQQRNRDIADLRFADKENAATPSFQLRVQLAPLPAIASKLQTAERESQNKPRIQPQAGAPPAPQPVAPGRRRLQRPAADREDATPVRVLFVFRKATNKDKTHP